VIVPLVVLGAVFVAAGILGTGLTASGIQIPPIDSPRRQKAIAGFGLVVIVLGVAPAVHITFRKKAANTAPVVATVTMTATTVPPTIPSTTPPDTPSPQPSTRTSAPPFVRTGIVLPAGSGISFDTDADTTNPVPTTNTDIYFQDYAGTPELDAAYSSDPLSTGLPVDYRTCSSADVFSQGVMLLGNLLYNGAVICYRNHDVVAAVTVHHVPGMYEPDMYVTVDITVWRGSGT
jgi:hypothetical protein